MNQCLARKSQLHTSVMPLARNKRSRTAGFTLAELLAVVAMIGILATIAMVSYRRYMASSKVAEATYMVGQIRAAQESFRAETMRYFNVSTEVDSWYPATSDGQKRSWDFDTHADYSKWRQLGVRSDGPVIFGYSTWAGTAGTVPTQPTGITLTFPNAEDINEPWYLVQAAGDLTPGGAMTLVLGSSFTNEIHIENEGQ